MVFRFVQTADWQIGKTFGGFPADTASLLRHGRMTAIDRIAAAARAHKARDVIVCGDVFDSPALPDRVLRETLIKLANHPAVVWHLLPGNHDPAREDGVWARVAALGLPANVRLLLKPEPIEIAPGAWLLPAPLLAKSVATDPTAWMDAAATPAAAVRIGVAHGSTQGFGSSGLASVGIDPGRRRSAGLDYLALGDWHGVREIAPGVWYSGTPEPDQFPDNEPGFALAVTIEGRGREPKVIRCATGLYAWARRTIAVATASDLAAVEAEIAGRGADKSNMLLELTLSGTVSLSADAEISARLVELEAGLLHLVLRREHLVIDAGGSDIAALGDAQVGRVAERLESLRLAGGDNAAVAEGALRRLFTLKRALEGQRS